MDYLDLCYLECFTITLFPSISDWIDFSEWGAGCNERRRLEEDEIPCVYFTFSKRHHPFFFFTYTVALEEKAELKRERNEARIGEVCVDIRSIRIP